MKAQLQWSALVIGMIVLIAGSLGCATMAASSVASDSDFYNRPLLSDEIIAIGKPDPALLKKMEQPNAVAFIGKKHTYMLYKGGDELDQVSQLKLDPQRMAMDLSSGRNLYRKDNQVWGEILLSYNTTSNDELAELTKGGFSAIPSSKNMVYQKTIYVEGVLYQAINIPPEQLSKLTKSRHFYLYNPRDAKPPILGKILKVPLVITAVAVDIVLAPVYIGAGALVLIGAAGNP